MPKQTPKTSKKQMPKKSPLAPKSFPKMPAIDGLWLGAGESGTKYKDRPDVMLVAVEKKSVIAGALTKSSMPSAAVEWCRTLLTKGAVRGLVVNAGNANAFTGKTGDKANYQLAAGAAKALNVLPEEVFVASTGVIGEDLKTPALLKTIANLADGGLSPTAWQNCARAIMTTDTFPKGVTRTTKIGSVEVNLNGIAKGSGMIAPDMATMLAFFFTDADLPPSVLRQLVNDNLPSSFNAITVDSDTSTSDTVLLIATGARKLSGKPIRSIKDPRLKGFNQSLKEAMQELAQQIVRDGEGATKFITVNVSGAADDASARLIALAIANSPLVKTAIAGEDPNWGRVVMAVGKSGEPANRDRLKVKIGDFNIAKNGRVIANYDERPVAKYMKGREIVISVDVGIGKGSARVWTSDLTHEYISINADYRS